MSMSTRLQIVMSEEEAARLHRCAARSGLSLSEWARRAMRRFEGEQCGPSAHEKLRALDRALGCAHPTGDIDQILDEIETGRDLR